LDFRASDLFVCEINFPNFTEGVKACLSEAFEKEFLKGPECSKNTYLNGSPFFTKLVLEKASEPASIQTKMDPGWKLTAFINECQMDLQNNQGFTGTRFSTLYLYPYETL